MVSLVTCVAAQHQTESIFRYFNSFNDMIYVVCHIERKVMLLTVQHCILQTEQFALLCSFERHDRKCKILSGDEKRRGLRAPLSESSAVTSTSFTHFYDHEAHPSTSYNRKGEDTFTFSDF
jgi:hypothetical protein